MCVDVGMPVCGCCKRSLKKPVRTNKSEPKFLDSVEKAYQHYHFILNAKLQFTDLLHISYYITEHNNFYRAEKIKANGTVQYHRYKETNIKITTMNK